MTDYLLVFVGGLALGGLREEIRVEEVAAEQLGERRRRGGAREEEGGEVEVGNRGGRAGIRGAVCGGDAGLEFKVGGHTRVFPSVKADRYDTLTRRPGENGGI